MHQKCDYCGSTDCHRCPKKMQHDIRAVLDQLEEMICVPDGKDGPDGIINNHLRNAWWARDKINAMFAKALGEELKAQGD